MSLFVRSQSKAPSHVVGAVASSLLMIWSSVALAQADGPDCETWRHTLPVIDDPVKVPFTYGVISSLENNEVRFRWGRKAGAPFNTNPPGWQEGWIPGREDPPTNVSTTIGGSRTTQSSRVAGNRW